MGEKVHIASGASDSPQPPTAKPLDYAARELSPRFDENLLRMLGGWPQLVFAVGLATVGAAICYAFGGYRGDDACIFVFAGLLLIGVVIRVPLRRNWW